MSKSKLFNFSIPYILGTAIVTFASSSMAIGESKDEYDPTGAKAPRVLEEPDEVSSKKPPLHPKLLHLLAIGQHSEFLFPPTWNAVSRQQLTQILYETDSEAIQQIVQILMKCKGNKGVYTATPSLTESLKSFVQSLASCSPSQLSVIHKEFDALFPTEWTLESCTQLVQLLSNTDAVAIPITARLLGQINWGEHKYSYRLSNFFTDEMQIYLKTILSIKK